MLSSIIVNGLVMGGIYAVLAVGFSLIFGVAKILNLAHTAFYMLTAYLVFAGTTMAGFSLQLSLFLAVITVTVLGMLCFYFLFDRIKHHETAVMIISVAVALLLQEILLMVFGGHYRGVPPFVQGFQDIFGIRVSYQQIIAIMSTGVVLLGLWILLAKTSLGNAIRAVAQDREIANLMGINVSRIFLIVMGISVALAGLAGAVVAPLYVVGPMMWMHPLTIVLAAVVLGGLGSVGGCVLGALILGFVETTVVFTIPGGAFLQGTFSLAIMVLVLMVRPEGLFGVVFEEERL